MKSHKSLYKDLVVGFCRHFRIEGPGERARPLCWKNVAKKDIKCDRYINLELIS